ncbi:hypothetical protein COLO4_00066 [Corchorus olitorius]|uniref:Uncharacterized protein n=1 Tax=Corchorus olitorius TaxID=93759 RepID=A0A1R3L4V3_9ROSI|nr:hypothetical protein COLO4_00066 [Corchorus olitorius]
MTRRTKKNSYTLTFSMDVFIGLSSLLVLYFSSSSSSPTKQTSKLGGREVGEEHTRASLDLTAGFAESSEGNRSGKKAARRSTWLHFGDKGGFVVAVGGGLSGGKDFRRHQGGG